MRVATWNVQKGLRPNQAPFLEELEPDLVALQELSKKYWPFAQATLARLGLHHVVHTLDDEGRGTSGGLALASRRPLTRTRPTTLVLPMMERALCAVVESPARAINVVTVHVPPGMRKVNGRPDASAKVGTFTGLIAHFKRTVGASQILLGDFNTPEDEFSDGRMAFFGDKRRLFGDKRQHEVEEEFYKLVAFGVLRDAFRSANFVEGQGFKVPAKSWWNRANRVTSEPRRFDHVFLSLDLESVSARYGDAERIWGGDVSDHLPLVVEVRVGESPGAEAVIGHAGALGRRLRAE